MLITEEALRTHEIRYVKHPNNICAVCKKHWPLTEDSAWRQHVRSSTHRWKANLRAGRQAVRELQAVAAFQQSRSAPFIQRIPRCRIPLHSCATMHYRVYLLSGQVCFETDVVNDSLGRSDLHKLLSCHLMVAQEIVQLHFKDHCPSVDSEVTLTRADAGNHALHDMRTSDSFCQLCCMRSHSVCFCVSCQSWVCYLCATTFAYHQDEGEHPIPCWGCAEGTGDIRLWARARALVLMPAGRVSAKYPARE